MASVAEIAAECHGVIDDYGFYVYYLCDDDKILSVGKSTRLLTRTHHHVLGKRSKEFRYFLYRRCASEWAMKRLEAEEINRLKPPLNSVIPQIPLTHEESLDRQRMLAKGISDAIVGQLPEVIGHAS